MKIEPMKNRIDRTTDPQIKKLLETVLDALEDVVVLCRHCKGRLDELELEQESYLKCFV